MTIPHLTLRTIDGQGVPLPDPSSRLVHLQFRRFAGCPICHAHLMSLARRKPELTSAGVREIVLFHSSEAEVRTYEADLPFDVVADPDKQLYRQFGVRTSTRSLLHPAIFGAAIRGASVVFRGPGRRLWIPKAENGRLGQPAEFLIDATGRVVASKFGRHAADQWSADEVLAFAQGNRAAVNRGENGRDRNASSWGQPAQLQR